MNTVIIPVDYSETSLHAAKYAVQLLSAQDSPNVLLYHHYTKASDGPAEEKKLNDLKTELGFKGSVETLAHHGSSFIDDFEKAVRHRRADLVIMGITGKSGLSKIFIGSNTLKFSGTKAAPVLIVPEKAHYREIKNVMLATDFRNAFNVTPSMPIKDFLKAFNPMFHIVNVDPQHYVSLTESYEKERVTLENMFSEFNPEFYFMRLFDVDEALNLFAADKNIDLIIAVQKEHSLFERMFKKSTTKGLSYQNELPILVVHE
ncbi:MAG: universal stress protein [Chitinophagaceae bacterium]|nr:universal stress protein [Chitinophagaceae bacterium]